MCDTQLGHVLLFLFFVFYLTTWMRVFSISEMATWMTQKKGLIPPNGSGSHDLPGAGWLL